jgi:integrase
MKKYYKGSIFARNGKLSVKSKTADGVWVTRATGLLDTKLNRRMLATELEHRPEPIAQSPSAVSTIHALIHEYLHKRGVDVMIPTLRTYTKQLFNIFPNNHSITKEAITHSLTLFVSKPLSARTIHNHLTALFTMWSYMAEHYSLPPLPRRASLYRKPPTTKEANPYTQEEFLSLYTYLSSRNEQHFKEFAILLYTMYHTGARWVDCSTLVWDAITDNTIRWHNKRTKEVEEVPVATHVITLINTLPRTHAYVFRWRKPSPSRCLGWLRSACSACNIPYKPFHSLRKSFAMRVFSKAIPLKDQLALVRHKSVDTTIKHYLRTTESLHSAVESL